MKIGKRKETEKECRGRSFPWECLKLEERTVTENAETALRRKENFFRI